MLLPREHLPLSSLDLSCPLGHLPESRLFESHIRILELEGRLGSSTLIARSDSNASVYVVERQQSGLYVLCKLGDWVQLGDLGRSATALCQQRVQLLAASATTDITYEPPLITPQSHKENKRKRLAIEKLQSMVRKQPRSQPAAVAAMPDQQITNSVGDDSQPRSADRLPVNATSESPVLGPQPPAAMTSKAPVPEAVSLEQPTAENIFQNILNQYFETLYHSMVCWSSHSFVAWQI